MTFLLFTLNDSDVGSDIPFPEDFTRRDAARAAVFDADGNIALCHVNDHDYHKIPGGGIEEGENTEEGLRREIIEEAGCAIKNINPVGYAEEYRAQFAQLQTSHMFIAHVDGEKRTPEYDAGEQEAGFSLQWLPPKEALTLLKKDAQNAQEYEVKFMTQRDSKLLEIALNQHNKD